MLVGFLGTACSGKTTLASKLFTYYKEKDIITAELIVEIARLYIAEYKFKNNLSANEKISLSPDDQYNIAKRQAEVETMMKFSTGETTVVIADSCTLNSLLYMPDAIFDNDKFLMEFINKFSKQYDMIVYCHPFHLSELPSDNNRIHNLEEIKLANYKAEKIFKIIQSQTKIATHESLGALPLQTRYINMLSAVNSHYSYLMTIL